MQHRKRNRKSSLASLKVTSEHKSFKNKFKYKIKSLSVELDQKKKCTAKHEIKLLSNSIKKA